MKDMKNSKSETEDYKTYVTKAIQKEYEKFKIYTLLAFILIFLIICMWFFSHFRVSIIPVNTIDSIAHTQHYTCPAVPDTTSIDMYLGCRETYLDEHIDSKVLKRGIVFYWI